MSGERPEPLYLVVLAIDTLPGHIAKGSVVNASPARDGTVRINVGPWELNAYNVSLAPSSENLGPRYLAEIPHDLVEARNVTRGQRPGWAVAVANARDLFVKPETLMERIALDEALFALVDAHGVFRLEAEARGIPVSRDWYTKLDELLTEGGR